MRGGGRPESMADEPATKGRQSRADCCGGIAAMDLSAPISIAEWPRTKKPRYNYQRGIVIKKNLASALTVALTVMLLFASSRASAVPDDGDASASVSSTPCLPTAGCIPTISAANIGRIGNFYVGGKWQEQAGQEIMAGSMFVEVWVPRKIQHPYPVVFVQGGGGQGLFASIQTPDGRPGWAYDFVNAGYTVYMVDPPGGGRSNYFPGLYEPLAAPRGAEQMGREWSGGACARCPGAKGVAAVGQAYAVAERCAEQGQNRRPCV